MNKKLLLLSGGDIPWVSARASIRQPTLKHISYIGEDAFFSGCELLKFSKQQLNSQGNMNLDKLSNFEIIMMIMNNAQALQAQGSVMNAFFVLGLLFPWRDVRLEQHAIRLIAQQPKKEENDIVINEQSYPEFREILIEMFKLKKDSENGPNPQGAAAKRIAAKLAAGRKKKQQLKKNQPQTSVYGRYASILAVGLGKDLNSLMSYTVYQLMDEFERYQLKVHQDIYIQAKMAGAKDMKQPDDWCKDLYVENKHKDDLY